MVIEPIIYEPTFRGFYHQTLKTSYGKHIVGKSGEYQYDIYIKGDKNHIEHKLYYVTRAGEWIKSKLLFFENNKLTREVKSRNAKLDYTTDI